MTPQQAPAQGADHDSRAWQAYGYPRPIDFDRSNVLLKATHTWGAPLLQRGRKSEFALGDAAPLLSEQDHIAHAVRTYERRYSRDRERAASKRGGAAAQDSIWRNGFARAILRSHVPEMLLHSFWAAAEVAFRVLSPFALRGLVRWLQQYDSDKESVSQGTGWLWASLVVVFGAGLALSHHQLFWVGMRMGLGMKQQAIAAVQEKLLRLNGATLGHLSSGQIVNLVSNDVRRCAHTAGCATRVWGVRMECSVLHASMLHCICNTCTAKRRQFARVHSARLTELICLLHVAPLVCASGCRTFTALLQCWCR